MAVARKKKERQTENRTIASHARVYKASAVANAAAIRKGAEERKRRRYENTWMCARASA